MTVLRLHNTLTRKKENFSPINPDHVRVYACGPTVYGRIHIGNARPIVVFDVLVRLLRLLHSKVTYVRNITDVDDKINARAAERGISIDELCTETIETFHQDTVRLGALDPDIEPRATHHIDEMKEMIATLIDKGHAYETDGHVLFDVSTMDNYGSLSKRSVDDMIAGARVEIASYKRDAADFILWKPSNDDQPGWDSPWGLGRPGWHIECSAMAKTYLGEVFDIHAGGLDLIFPHHENEIAQSCCAHNNAYMAHYWLHNGFVTMNDVKMSKSLGNTISVADVADKYRGETLRVALLAAHYRAPLDLSDNSLRDARNGLDRLYRAVGDITPKLERVDADFTTCLLDDLNTPAAIARLHELARLANRGEEGAAEALKSSAAVLGLLQQTASAWAKADKTGTANGMDDDAIDILITIRKQARANRDFAKADEIRDQLTKADVMLEDSVDGTIWRRR
ncbi:cysteine--tRNA ligase [Candidatus Puniceispirillum sp.]|nr:cysteine--tRNA ligase [Candidatus Puniceispirillum sp.]